MAQVRHERERTYRAETGQMIKRVAVQDYEEMSGVYHTKMEVVQSDRVTGASHLYVGITREFSPEQAKTKADLEWQYALEWLNGNDNRLMPFHKEKVRERLGVNEDGQRSADKSAAESGKVS